MNVSALGPIGVKRTNNSDVFMFVMCMLYVGKWADSSLQSLSSSMPYRYGFANRTLGTEKKICCV